MHVTVYNKIMNKNRFSFSGFTLMELLIATIIIGVLVAISIPLYLKNAEKAMGAKALENLQNIFNAEMLYMAENETFTNNRAVLSTYSAIGPDDADWTYGITATQSTFLITATRTSPNPTYNGLTITMDESSNITGVPYPP